MIDIAIGVGDGYSPDTQAEFISYLSKHGFNCIQIPLVETNPAATYDDLSADNYCEFIDKYLDSKKQYWMFGISKSCHWFRVYASKRSNIKKLILVEPTTMNPRLLVEYEKSRDNFFITDYFQDAEEHEEYDVDRKALDSIVSDNKAYFPKCPINIIWTSRNNEDEPYDNKVLMLKRKFEQYLKTRGCHVKVFHIDSNHNATSYPRNFAALLKYIMSLCL